MSFQIVGTGRALPKRVVTNEELTHIMETSDEWIRSRTGIAQRHVAADETITELAAEAAQNALDMAGLTPADIDYILCPTIGGDFISPSLASMIQMKLGAHCPTADLNSACAGFVYALDMAAGLFARKRVRNMLVVAGEGLTRILNWDDRSTCILLGDGAGAVVLTEGDCLQSTVLTSTGEWDKLYIPYPQGTCPFTPKKENWRHGMYMDGQEVYKFAVGTVPAVLDQALEQAGVRHEQIDHVFLHQANKRIIDATAKHIPIPAGRFHCNIERMGNMSSASIPVILDEVNRAGLLKRGQRLAMCGFGAGLVTGAAVLTW